jgi:hypothetical protein
MSGCSPDGAQRNPGANEGPAPDFAPLNPGYGKIVVAPDFSPSPSA